MLFLLSNSCCVALRPVICTLQLPADDPLLFREFSEEYVALRCVCPNSTPPPPPPPPIHLLCLHLLW